MFENYEAGEWKKIWVGDVATVYSVNNLGQVRNDYTKKILAESYNQQGMAKVSIFFEDKPKTLLVSNLVATAFLPTPPTHFTTPININGDRANCEASNLAWRPRWFAVKYHQQFRSVLWQAHKDLQMMDLDTGEMFARPHDIVLKYGVLLEDLIKIKRRPHEEHIIFPIRKRFSFFE